MAVQYINISSDGTIPLIKTAGFHGVIGDKQTPARRQAVYVDANDFLVRVTKTLDSNRILADLTNRPIRECVWQSTRTRLPSWTAHLNFIVLIIGSHELKLIDSAECETLPSEMIDTDGQVPPGYRTLTAVHGKFLLDYKSAPLPHSGIPRLVRRIAR